MELDNIRIVPLCGHDTQEALYLGNFYYLALEEHLAGLAAVSHLTSYTPHAFTRIVDPFQGCDPRHELKRI